MTETKPGFVERESLAFFFSIWIPLAFGLGVFWREAFRFVWSLL